VAEAIILVGKMNVSTLNRDFMVINKMNISDNNNVLIGITFYGGCKEHTFKLYGFFEDDKNLSLHLEHNANGDQCKRLIREELFFDLSPIRKYYTIGLGKIPFASLKLKLGKLEAEYSFS
jgi:hypothetical protein